MRLKFSIYSKHLKSIILIAISILISFNSYAENLIRIGSSYRTLQLDPIKSAAGGDIETFGVLYSRLFRRNAVGKIAPALAKSWSYSDDRKQLTLNLRKANFSNGTPILAEDVVFSLRRFRDHDASVLGQSISRVTQMIACDDSTVVLSLSEPFSPLLDYLEWSYAGIVSSQDVEARGEEGAFSANPVTSGPYRVVEWKLNDRLIVEANPYYWRSGYPKNDGAELIEVPNSITRISMLLAGELDAVRGIPWPKVAVLRDYENIHVALEDAIAIQLILINHKRPPFDDLRVRQAAALALDREAIAKVVTRGNATAANTVLPAALKYYDEQYPGWPYDPQRARELLKTAGKIGEEVTIMIRSRPEIEKIAVIMQAQWLAIGLKAKIIKVNQGLSWEYLQTGNYDAVPSWYFNENSDPDGAIRWALCGDCGSYSYYTYFQNEEVNQLLEQGVLVENEEARRKIYEKIQSIASEQVSQIPLFNKVYRNAYSTRIKGLRLTPALQWTLEETELLNNDGSAFNEKKATP